MSGSYHFTHPYQIEIEKAQSAIDHHTLNIAYLNADILKKQKSLQRRQKLLEKAKKRLETAKRLLSENTTPKANPTS